MKRSILMILCFTVLFSCKKKDDNIDYNRTDYDEFIEFFSEKEEYADFMDGLETIGARQVLGDNSYTIFLPKNTSQNNLTQGKLKSDIILDSETFYLNHIIHGKYGLTDLKYRAVNHLDALSLAKLETNSGIEDYITVDLDEDKEQLKANGVVIGKKLFSNRHYVVYSIPDALLLSKLKDVVVDFDFYKQVINQNSTFAFLDSLNNHSKATLISLSNDAVNRFLSVNDNSNTQDFIDRWISNSFIPSYTFSPSDFYPEEQTFSLENLLTLNTTINIQTKVMGSDYYKGINIDFEDPEFSFVFFTNYLKYNFNSPLNTVHPDIKVTSTGTLIIVDDFIQKEK